MREPLRYGRLKAFTGPRAEERAHRAGTWARATLFGDANAKLWCRDNSIALTKASAESPNTAGGFLVPDELLRSIVNLRELAGAFRQAAEIVPMSRDTLNWPRRTGGLTAYFLAENTAPPESQVTLDSIGLTAKKIGALVKMSSELADDSAADIGEFLASEVAYAFAAKEDDCGFNGDGTSTYGGMRGVAQLILDGTHAAAKVTAATGHNTFGTLDATDLAALIAAVQAIALPGARWYCTVFAYANTFCRLAAANGGGHTAAMVNGRLEASYLGFPIVISQKLPQIGTSLSGSVMMLFGDLSLAAALGERRGVTVRRLAERFADADQIGIMGTERFNINVHDLGTNTAAGPIAGLVAP